MSPATIKQVYTYLVLAWCAWMGLIPVLAMKGLMAGPAALAVSGAAAALILGSYAYLSFTNRT